MVNNEQDRPASSQAELEAAAMVHASPPSLWPVLTALAATAAMVGIMVHPLVVVIAGLLTLAAIVAWGVEGAHH
ncbi:MAG: hypothetical protein ACYC4L_07865 [Chloroflexota bacterium]